MIGHHVGNRGRWPAVREAETDRGLLPAAMARSVRAASTPPRVNGLLSCDRVRGRHSRADLSEFTEDKPMGIATPMTAAGQN